MPVYNGGIYLEKAIGSILTQTFTDFEFIIIDDGSTDNSLVTLSRYAAQDSRIKLVSRENRGLVKTLNQGIELAQSALIARMDADDIAMPERFAMQKAYLDNNPEILCVGGRVKVIDSKGRFLISNDAKTNPEDAESSALNGISPIIHPSAMLRTEALKQVGGYHEADYPAEDLALWLNLCAIGKINNIPDIVLKYRIHNDSISTGLHHAQLEKTRQLCAEACKKKGIPFEFKAREGRPLQSRASKHEIDLRHGWWAFTSKQWQTAFIYALKAIKWLPYKLDGWRLLYCSLFKRK